MANGNFIVQNGLTVGPLTIDAATGSINTTGTVSVSGLAVSEISKNDSKITINDTGTGSNVSITIDGTVEHIIDANGVNLTTGDGYSINGTSVLTATTLGSGVVNSSLTSVGTLTGLTVAGTTNLQGTTIGTENVTNGNVTTLRATNFGTGNAVISGGSVAGVSSIQTTGGIIASTVSAGTIGNTGATLTGTLSTATQNSVTTMTGLTGFGTAGVVTTAAGHLTVTGNLTVNGTQNIINNTIYETTEYVVTQNATNGNIGTLAVTTGFSTANAVVTGGSINNVTVGATTHTTGRFTTVTATTVNAGTIGNTGATLTGTLNTAAQTSITSVGTLTGLTVSGAIVPNGNATVDSGSSTAYWNNLYARNGYFDDLTVGGGASTFASNVTVTGYLMPAANVSYDIGSGTTWWRTFYGTSTQAKYADLAENYQADKAYNPGTVLMFGGEYEVTQAAPETTAVAGIVSTNPAHLMNGALSGTNVVPLALTGRVPCMVIGPVKKGDMMVSAGFGYAKASANPAIGSVIGKSLEDYPMQAKGVIEVVVGRL